MAGNSLVFLADSVEKSLRCSPFSVLGAMLLFAGIELGKIAFKIKRERGIMLIVGALAGI
ncbi:hypothetical protein CW709_01360 [Candidatus Bathyarchaeota archaeon]|nr:MAG: hypothetical protein CW709_01360 [Candidatus Bathyarchaeota archaeon]